MACAVVWRCFKVMAGIKEERSRLTTINTKAEASSALSGHIDYSFSLISNFDNCSFCFSP